MNDVVGRSLLDGEKLDAAIDHARAALAALLRTRDPQEVAEARALLGTLLGRRVARAAARMDE